MTTVSRMRELPADIHDLAALSAEEGFAFLLRLVEDFTTGSNTFSDAGEALFEVRTGGLLVAIGGLNRDPYAAHAGIGRVRRFYVHPEYRCRGIGRLLLEAIECHARGHFELLRLRTDSTSAGSFYSAAGYLPLNGDPAATHVRRLCQ